MLTSVKYSVPFRMEGSDMLGKLLKYDLKSLLRTFLPLWAALLGVSLLNRITMSLRPAMTTVFDIPSFILLMIYLLIIMAVFVITLVLIVLRFYNGLLKDEGYLMFTLPVKTWELIASKGISATILSILSSSIAVLSVVIVGMNETLYEAIAEGLQQLFTEYQTAIPSIVLLLLNGFFGAICSVLMMYCAMAFGHIASKNRVAWSILAYIAINTVFSTLEFAVTIAFAALNWAILFPLEPTRFFGIYLIYTIARSVLFFFITERILSRRLNLE